MSPDIESYLIAEDLWKGIPMKWPRFIQKQETVQETFVVVITKHEQDLRSIHTSAPWDYDDLRSKGEKYWKTPGPIVNPYEVMRIQYNLRWPTDTNALSQKFLGVGDLPPPEIAYKSTEVTEKGAWGGFSRWLRNITPYVWVMNQHVESIRVVVSPSKPRRIVTGGGVSGSATGAGVNIESQV
jgi:hypothetical protein